MAKPTVDATEAKVEAEFYFSIIPEFVVDCGKPRAIQVYAILARYSNAVKQAWPGRALIATRASCSVDTVDRALRDLESIKAIRVDRSKKEDGSYENNVYTLLATEGGRTHAATPNRTTAEGVPAPARTQLKPLNESQGNDIATASQDDFWDALEGVFGYRPIGSEAALWGRIIKHVEAAGDPPAEIPRRAALWLVGPVWEGRQPIPRLTPAALLKWWQWLGSRIATASASDLNGWRDEYNRQMTIKRIEEGANNA